MKSLQPDSSVPFLSAESKISFASLLSGLNNWFTETARILPWRSEPTPYRVWISEIMLQQTVVAAVIPYFNRFINRFPDVSSLASASLDEVLTLWSGLGYYSRAKNLHRAAQILAEKGFPQTRSGWEALPGVGPYTAGAILSIAYNRPEAILDGNIERVWSRFRCISPGSGFKEHLWRLSRYAVETTSRSGFSPSVINQSLMELGALVCRPSAPDCGKCPLSPRCLAFLRGVQSHYPQRKRREALETIEETVYIYRLPDGRVYLPPPSDGQRWRKGMRDFPTEEVAEWKTSARFLKQAVTTHTVTRYKIIRTVKILLLDISCITSVSDEYFFDNLSKVPCSASCLKSFKILSDI